MFFENIIKTLQVTFGWKSNNSNTASHGGIASSGDNYINNIFATPPQNPLDNKDKWQDLLRYFERGENIAKNIAPSSKKCNSEATIKLSKKITTEKFKAVIIPGCSYEKKLITLRDQAHLAIDIHSQNDNPQEFLKKWNDIYLQIQEIFTQLF